jgi:hypothetical protein
VPLVVVPAPRVAEESSPELRRRTALPRRAVRHLRRVLAARAALDGFGVSRASLWCFPRAKSSPLARSRASPPPPAVARRRHPPLSTGRVRACVHPQPLDPDLATLINPPPLFKPTATASHPI